jgi:hypothetical protein
MERGVYAHMSGVRCSSYRKEFMADLTFEEIVQAAQKLSAPQKAALIQTLQIDDENVRLTREQAIAELEALRAAGAFDQVESLAGKYARPGLDISAEDLNAYLQEIGTEWEEELDDLIDHD